MCIFALLNKTNVVRQVNKIVLFVVLIFNKTYMGKSYTASSRRILQGLTAAKVVGCSGAM